MGRMRARKVVRFLIKLLLVWPVKLLIKCLIGMIRLVVWPFRSRRNAGRAAIAMVALAYIGFSEYRQYLLVGERYGSYLKFFCHEAATKEKLKQSVVRIVGGLSEGSGFFTSTTEVLTSFHVIEGEPSPKIIFPDGTFVTPVEIGGNEELDLARLRTDESYPDLVLEINEVGPFMANEQLLAAGYPLGTVLPGEVTILTGSFNSSRKTRQTPATFIQTDISLVDGMSGGPLTDRCGKVMGVNTMGIGGLSLFVSYYSFAGFWNIFSDTDIAKIELDPAASPEEAVEAFYTYLKARRMEDGFKLLSVYYLASTDFEEWTSRFPDVIDVQVYQTQLVEGTDRTVAVKFSTKIWDGEEAQYHFYEGTWETVWEDGTYKMLKSDIEEVENPSWDWFYTFES